MAQNAYLVFINRLGEIGIEPPVDVEVYIDTLQLKIIVTIQPHENIF
jgi:hypothetical protein